MYYSLDLVTFVANKKILVSAQCLVSTQWTSKAKIKWLVIWSSTDNYTSVFIQLNDWGLDYLREFHIYRVNESAGLATANSAQKQNLIECSNLTMQVWGCLDDALVIQTLFDQQLVTAVMNEEPAPHLSMFNFFYMLMTQSWFHQS